LGAITWRVKLLPFPNSFPFAFFVLFVAGQLLFATTPVLPEVFEAMGPDQRNGLEVRRFTAC
jgi:hypothetical protein